MKKPRGSSVARAQDPWITSQTLYHRATWDPQDFMVIYFFTKFGADWLIFVDARV